jgi:paraquat-inducible protein A
MREPPIITLLHYVVASVLAVLIVISAGDISRSHARLSQALSPEARSEAAIHDALAALSLGMYAGAEQERLQITALNTRVLQDWRRANWLAVALFCWSGAFLALRFRPALRSRWTQHALSVATIFLVVGLLAPMLSIVAQREVPILGHVILRYESKAIIGTTLALLHKGNWVIGAALGIFSIILPLLKLLASLIGCAQQGRLGTICRDIVHYIGKWSLTDVFIVAVLLAFMAGDSGDSTNAWIGHGLWFFAAYAVLSWIAGHRLNSNSAQPDPQLRLTSAKQQNVK